MSNVFGQRFIHVCNPQNKYMSMIFKKGTSVGTQNLHLDNLHIYHKCNLVMRKTRNVWTKNVWKTSMPPWCKIWRLYINKRIHFINWKHCQKKIRCQWKSVWLGLNVKTKMVSLENDIFVIWSKENTKYQ